VVDGRAVNVAFLRHFIRVSMRGPAHQSFVQRSHQRIAPPLFQLLQPRNAPPMHRIAQGTCNGWPGPHS